MISIGHVHYQVEGKTILHDINLELAPGGVIALIGPNGAGKSTLLSLMSRITPLQSGVIRFDDLDIARSDTREIARKVAILQQQTRFMSRLTIEDLLVFARFPHHRGRPRAEDRAIIEQTLGYFALDSLRRTFIDELSGGQRQRALVAMVFAQNSDYILLDEPLNNLDMHYAHHLMHTLRRAVQDFGKTIVIVLHDINFAAHYADSVVALQHGRVMASGACDAVLTAARVSELYGTPVDTLRYRDKPVFVYAGECSGASEKSYRQPVE